MNTLRNKVQLIGRIGATPEVVTFDSGRKLARFSLATNESYKNKDGEWVENTQWFQISTWGKSADLVEKLITKGSDVAIEGKLVTSSYETKEGEKRYQTSVEMNEFMILSKKKVEAGEQ